MSQDNDAIEIKVGALVLVSLILLGGFVFVLGDVSFTSGRKFHIRFENAAGLKPGADVAIAGLKVGQVDSLHFVRNESAKAGRPAVSVRATVSVSAQHADSIRKGSEFYISTRSVLGENYIEVVTPSLESPPLPAGATVQGNSPPRSDLLITKTSRLLDSLLDLFQNPAVTVDEFFAETASLIKHLDAFFVDNRQSFDELLTSIRDAAANASNILSAVQYAVGEGKDLRATLKNVRATASHSRNVAARMKEDLGPLTDDLSKMASNARNVSRVADEMLRNNQPKINDSIANLEKSTKNWQKLSSDANRLIARIEKGKGTVGQLLQDRKMYDDLREVLRIIKRQPWKIIWKE